MGHTHVHTHVHTHTPPENESAIKMERGRWTASLLEHPTLGFSSGRDLGVPGSRTVWAPCWAWSLLEILSNE